MALPAQFVWPCENLGIRKWDLRAQCGNAAMAPRKDMVQPKSRKNSMTQPSSELHALKEFQEFSANHGTCAPKHRSSRE